MSPREWEDWRQNKRPPVPPGTREDPALVAVSADGILAAAADLADDAQRTCYTPWERAHALAEAALWRGIAERHADHEQQCGDWQAREECSYCGGLWPCPDLRAAAAAVRAYTGGVP